MTKILIISPDRKWLSRECQDSDMVRFLLDYTINNNIPTNRKYRDEHKLLLDISRSGHLAVVSRRDSEDVYISEVLNEDQYAGYLGYTSENKVINCYDWYDSSDEYNGYRILESNSKSKKSLDLEVRQAMLSKLMKNKAAKLSKSKKSTF
ncbi:MAG: hypothetical protein IJI43_00850 [Bacilli bacterium]|nr:hypothetical protein [Bacilli bacterium]